MESDEAGVLIIGGGIIGLAVAYYLSKGGSPDEVLLLERESSLLSHASGHNAGGISSAHLFQTPEMRALARRTNKLYLELSKTEGFDFDFRVNGSIDILGEGEPTRNAQRLLEALEGFRDEDQGRVEILTGGEAINEREPNISVEKVQRALYYPEDAQGNSSKLGKCFSRICSEKGVTLGTGVEVTGFETRNRAIVNVVTNKGEIHPETVVLAGGPWSGKIASTIGLTLPVEPIKGHLITTHSSESRVLNTFVSSHDYYVLQNGDGALVVGGGEDAAGFDSSIIQRRAEEAWRKMSSLVPVLEHLGQEAISACLRPFAPDGIPIIGRSSRFDNLFLATGHFRNGFSLAPVTGTIISELILSGESDMELTPFSPARFGA